MIKNKMNPIDKNDDLRLVGLVALPLEITMAVLPIKAMPEWLSLLMVILIMLTMMFIVKNSNNSNAVLDADEIKLVLSDYPGLKSWVESLLDKNELVTVRRVRNVISENAFEEEEKQRIAETIRLLEEQRKAVTNSDIRNR